MIERSPYKLDAVQLEKALQALQKAAETFRPSPGEERLYRVLGICVRAVVAAVVGMVLIGIVMVLARGGTETGSTAIFFGSLMAVFVLVFILAGISALVFLLLNQSVIRQAFRQRRLMKKLGIQEVSISAWRLQHKWGHSWSRLAGAVLTWGGVLSLLLGVFGWIGMWAGSEVGRKEEDVRIAVVVFSVFLLFFASGVTVLVWRFVQRSREQWAIVADANRLRSAIESMQTKAGAGKAVAVPAAVLDDVARIERVQIARERRDAVVASAGANRGYGVLVARDLSPQKALLDPQHRVAVEDLIDNLSANPHPAGVESTADNLLSVRTPDGGVELQYSVDEEARRVHIVALTIHDHA
jgi:hypothetical protein